MEIGIRADDLSPRSIAILLADKDRKRPHCTLQWPDDFAITEAPEQAGVSGLINVPIASDEKPFGEVVVRCAGEEVELGEDWRLTRLFPFVEFSFERRFYRRRNRVQDPETQRFSLLNILRHYHLNEAHRCVAAVIFAYRAVDSGSREDLILGRQYLHEQIGKAHLLSITGHERTDREHVHLSMVTALWHVHLALGDMQSMLATMDLAMAASKNIESPLSITAYNVCRAALLRGWMHHKAGEVEKSIAAHEYNFTFFKRCMANLTMDTTHLIEHKETHNIVLLSLQCVEKTRGGYKGMDVETVFLAACRSRLDEPRARLLEAFRRMARILSKQRQIAEAAAEAAKPEGEPPGVADEVWEAKVA